MSILSQVCAMGMPCDPTSWQCSCATHIASVPAAFSSCTITESRESMPRVLASFFATSHTPW